MALVKSKEEHKYRKEEQVASEEASQNLIGGGGAKHFKGTYFIKYKKPNGLNTVAIC